MHPVVLHGYCILVWQALMVGLTGTSYLTCVYPQLILVRLRVLLLPLPCCVHVFACEGGEMGTIRDRIT